MPAVIPLAIAAGTAIGSIGAAKIQSNSAHHAADVQSDYDNQALADARAQRTRDQQLQDAQIARQKQGDADYAAWLNGGTIGQLRAAVQGSHGYSDQPQMPGPAAPAPSGAAAISQPLTSGMTTIGQLRNAAGGTQGPGVASGPIGQMVTLRSPKGEVKQFAADDPNIPSYLQRGAMRVA